jgi:hypothetical protein
MATATWNANKDNVSSTDYGSGVDIHLPVGYMSWLGDAARAFIGYSYSWSGWTAINSATLYIKTDDGYHGSYSGDNVTFYVDLITGTWSEGSSASGETWHSSDDIAPAVSTTNRVTWTINGIATNTWYSKSITGIIQQAWASGSFNGLRFMSSNEGSSNERLGIWSTEKGSSYDSYIVVDYSTNTAPTAPTNLSPTGDAIVNSLTPTFTATFNDPDAGEIMGGYQIIVYADDGVTVKWDSGTIVGTSINKVYSGAALTGNTFYKWKVRTYDDSGAWGPYNTTLSRFKVNSIPNAPSISLTQTPTTDVKTLSPTFNVTHSDPDASDSQMLGYHIILETSTGTSVWDSGDVAVSARTTLSLTYSAGGLNWQSSYRWRARTQDSNGAWGAYSSNATFTTHTTGVPIGLTPTGGTVVPVDTGGAPDPTFTGSRATTADSLTAAQIILYQNDGVTQVWDSGLVSTGVSSTGFSRIYSTTTGATLAYSTTYKWKVRVTSSVGGTSAYSALQSFTTPASGSISMTAPVSPVTDTTPDFTFGRTVAFDAYQIQVLRVSDGATAWSSGTVSPGSATSRTVTYGSVGTAPVLTTLAFNTEYKWRVQVSSDGGSTWGTGWTGYVTFSMDSAGIPTLDAPTSDAWLGAPRVVDFYDNITDVTNGTSASASQDTTDKQVGRASMQVDVSTLTAGTTSETYRTFSPALDLSWFGKQVPIKMYVKASTLTNLGYIRVRFTFATTSDYAEYTMTPSGTSWEQKSVNKGTTVATGGTVDWTNVTRIGIRVNASGGAYTGSINVDDLKLDATNPSFDGTTYNSEVISTFRVRVYASDQTTLVWDSTDTGGSGTTFSIAYGGPALSKGVAYYWQARYVKSSGAEGNYSDLTPFRLNSDPSIPSNNSPSSGDVIADSLTPSFTTTFTDNERASLGDYPVSYEVEVYRNSDDVLAYSLFKDADLVAGANAVYDGESGVLKTTGAAAPLVYETEYKYRARYTDSKGAIGAWTSYIVFKPSESPTTTINTPVDSGTLTSPAFTVTWGMSSPGGKGQNSYRFRIVRNADSFAVYDSGRLYTSATSEDFPAGTLVNSTAYRIEVMTWDTDGLASDWDSNLVTTNWTAPDPIVEFSALADLDYSAVRLWWEESTVTPAEFRKYRIYRKLPSDIEWSFLVDLTNRSTVEYKDFMTANTVTYQYKITQWQKVTGDADLESGDSDIAEETLDADSWYIVGADRAPAHIFEVPVTAAPFQEPVQQEVFEPLGTSRKVIVRGKTLGAEGSLQCRWKDDEREIGKAHIEYIKSNAGPHILKSPFGDIWQVEFSGPTKDYMGGGHMNATLVWTEVA